MKLIYKPLDKPQIKNYFELEEWDVIDTSYGCPSNRGLWAVYQKRVECTFHNQWHIELKCFGISANEEYTPLANYGSQIYDSLQFGENYKKEYRILCESVYNLSSSIDENIVRQKFHVKGKLVDSSAYGTCSCCEKLVSNEQLNEEGICESCVSALVDKAIEMNKETSYAN